MIAARKLSHWMVPHLVSKNQLCTTRKGGYVLIAEDTRKEKVHHLIATIGQCMLLIFALVPACNPIKIVRAGAGSTRSL